MKLKNQVCSPELAKRLKELGAEQKSHFTWTDDPVNVPYLVVNQTKNYSYHFSAFTVAELGEMLPREVNGNTLAVYKESDGWHVTYSTVQRRWRREVDLNEADARALMLIYLLENKLITL